MRKSRPLVVLTALLLLVGLGCTLSLIQWPLPPIVTTTSPDNPSPPPPTPLPKASVTFRVSLPAPLLPGESLVLSLVDEVTHPSLSVTYYPMEQQDTRTYQAVIPLTAGGIVRYRYLRNSGGRLLPEATAENTPVRYRLLVVAGELTVQDSVASWSDQSFQGQTGAIQGTLRDAAQGKPLADVLVSVAGYQVLSDAQGRFHLPNIPVGTHNVTMVALDGAHSPFQQGAVIQSGMSTPVEVSLEARPLVPVTFVVSVPTNTPPGAPLRLAGNLLQLGNTFSEQEGGVSLLADRMPLLRALPDGRYALALQLPAGAYLQYKYTLGDSFWNAEQKAEGGFLVREAFVPPQGGTLEDRVASWQSGPSGPILFEVTVPSNTPLEDAVYLQLKIAGWSEPLPMWPVGNNRWVYRLFGPFNLVGEFRYRYCRNAQCGAADDQSTAGAANGRFATTSLVPQDLQDTVQRWAWLSTSQSTVVAMPVQPHGKDFIAGIEFQEQTDPAWLAYTSLALRNVQAMQANWVIFTPGWETLGTQPYLRYQPGRTPLAGELDELTRQAQATGLQVAFFPTPRSVLFAKDYWASAPRTPEWWQSWFESYRTFALHYATLAQQNGAQALILGGEWTAPAVSNGVLADGSPSNAPANADDLWRTLLRDVRAQYSGRIYWAMPAGDSAIPTPAFLDAVDGVYLLVSLPLSDQPRPSKEALLEAAERWADETLRPFHEATQKPPILALAYPSVRGAASGCLREGESCLPWQAFNQPNSHPAFTLDLQLQADIYEAFLTTLNSRPWVGGFVSRGYYPPALLQDMSASIHGKPAADLLWYWFPRLRQ